MLNFYILDSLSRQLLSIHSLNKEYETLRDAFVTSRKIFNERIFALKI